MISLNVRIIISFIIVTLAFLTVMFTWFLLNGLDAAFGSQDQSLDIALKMMPFVLGSAFVMHTLWSARSTIKKYEFLASNI